MPELPEVETIVRGLRPFLIGKTIQKAILLWERTLVTPSVSDFVRLVDGRTIVNITRRAKFLHILLGPPPLLSLIVHLRMSGDLQIRSIEHPTAPHDRLLLHLTDDHVLAFYDPRKFGRVWLVENPATVFARLGPEPLSEEFTPVWLYAALHRRHRQLKPLLLDQTFLAGLGNIYTDEALYRSRLHPLRLSDTITTVEAEHLHTAIRQVLLDGIACQGASIDRVYRRGRFQNCFLVYGKAGQPCSVCRTPIVRLIVGQRGTHICPNCQRRT